MTANRSVVEGDFVQLPSGCVLQANEFVIIAADDNGNPIAGTLKAEGTHLTQSAAGATYFKPPTNAATNYHLYIAHGGTLASPDAAAALNAANRAMGTHAITVTATAWTATADADAVTREVNQVLSADKLVVSGASFTIAKSGDTAYLAPAGTPFASIDTVANNRSTAAANATTMNAPVAVGTYHLFLKNGSGAWSGPSTASVRVVADPDTCVASATFIVAQSLALSCTLASDLYAYIAPSTTNAGTPLTTPSATITKSAANGTTIATPTNVSTPYRVFIGTANNNWTAGSTGVDIEVMSTPDTVLSAARVIGAGQALPLTEATANTQKAWLAPKCKIGKFVEANDATLQASETATITAQ
jgi:hypothetical protein